MCVCVFGYRVNVAGNLIVARVYIQFHGTFDRITGLSRIPPSPARISRKRISSSGQGQMIFNSAAPRAWCNWYAYGDRHHSSAFTFFLFLLLLLFFITPSLSKTAGATSDERKPHLLLFHPSGGIAGKSHRPGGPLAVAAADLIDGALTPVWHTFRTNATCIKKKKKKNKKKTTAWK